MNRQRRAAVLLLAVSLAGVGRVGHADPGGDYPDLLAQGEQALRRNQAGPALRAYERAAALRHEAVAEWGFVRSWMQAGDYRRALAFAAHAAGAHADVVEGAGLYAWLLHIGGQRVLARQTLDAAVQRQAAHPLLLATAERLRDPAVEPDPRLLVGATRQAPHAAITLPPQAQPMSSGLLLPSGLHALVPAEAVPRNAALWLRDAQGTELASAGPHGGPVFDRAGRLIGVALRGSAGRATLVAASALRSAWPHAFAVAPADAAQMSPDAVYERAMTRVVQFIVVRP